MTDQVVLVEEIMTDQVVTIRKQSIVTVQGPGPAIEVAMRAAQKEANLGARMTLVTRLLA